MGDMHQIRHTCNARLFDCLYEVHNVGGITPDIEVKCSRCSREKRCDVLVGYRLALPRSIPPIEPTAIYCIDLSCVARLCDLALPYTIVDRDGDIAIACQRCRKVTRIVLDGVYDI